MKPAICIPSYLIMNNLSAETVVHIRILKKVWIIQQI